MTRTLLDPSWQSGETMTLGDFTQQAAAYGKARPGYPDDLVDQLIADAGLWDRDESQGASAPEKPASFSPPSNSCRMPQIAPENSTTRERPSDIQPIPRRGSKITDLGAGTGILTRMLVERGFFVWAVEPNESMRQQANVPGATWVSGTFEDSGLETASVDWVVAAQAFHWADPGRCLPEMRRILKPGCLFTVMWNNRAPVTGDVVDWTQKTIQRHVPEFDEAYRDMENVRILESTGDFTFVCHRGQVHLVRMSRHRYLELWRSHNRLNTLAGPERFRQFYEELTEYLDQQQIDQIDVRYNCEAWSARRNG